MYVESHCAACMYVCVYIHVYTLRTNIQIHIHTHIHAYIQYNMILHTFTHTHTHSHTYSTTHTVKEGPALDTLFFFFLFHTIQCKHVMICVGHSCCCWQRCASSCNSLYTHAYIPYNSTYIHTNTHIHTGQNTHIHTVYRCNTIKTCEGLC